MKFINENCYKFDDTLCCYQCGCVILYDYENDIEEGIEEKINSMCNEEPIIKYFFNKEELVLLCDEKCLKDFKTENKENYDKKNELYIEKYFRVVHQKLLLDNNNILLMTQSTKCHNKTDLYKFLIEKKSSYSSYQEKILYISEKRHTLEEIKTFEDYIDNLDSVCYDDHERIICGYCNKLIDLDNDFYSDKDCDPCVYLYGKYGKGICYCNRKCVDNWIKKYIQENDDDQNIF